MTIVEHLQELRSRILRALVGIVLGAIIGFIWYEVTIDLGPVRIQSLGEILKAPYCSLPPEYRFGSKMGECRLLATNPFEMFMLRLKVGALAGLVFSSPWWLYQIWAFITPGLVRKEKRITLIVVAFAGLLFIAGAVTAYVVLAVGLETLLTIGDSAQIAALTGGEYYQFVILLLIIFGVSFEVPLFIIMLNIVGILQYSHIQGKRRLIYVGVFVFAAFASPGQEAITMVVLALCMCVLVEVSFQFCRINDKRRKRERPDWMDLDDESASSIRDAAPIAKAGSPAAGGVRASGDVHASGPVRASALDDRTKPVAASALDAPESVGGPSLIDGDGRVRASTIDAPAPLDGTAPHTRQKRTSRGGVPRPRTNPYFDPADAGFTYSDTEGTDWGDVL